MEQVRPSSSDPITRMIHHLAACPPSLSIELPLKDERTPENLQRLLCMTMEQLIWHYNHQETQPKQERRSFATIANTCLADYLNQLKHTFPMLTDNLTFLHHFLVEAAQENPSYLICIKQYAQEFQKLPSSYKAAIYHLLTLSNPEIPKEALSFLILFEIRRLDEEFTPAWDHIPASFLKTLPFTGMPMKDETPFFAIGEQFIKSGIYHREDLVKDYTDLNQSWARLQSLLEEQKFSQLDVRDLTRSPNSSKALNSFVLFLIKTDPPIQLPDDTSTDVANPHDPSRLWLLRFLKEMASPSSSPNPKLHVSKLISDALRFLLTHNKKTPLPTHITHFILHEKTVANYLPKELCYDALMKILAKHRDTYPIIWVDKQDAPCSFLWLIINLYRSAQDLFSKPQSINYIKKFITSTLSSLGLFATSDPDQFKPDQIKKLRSILEFAITNCVAQISQKDLQDHSDSFLIEQVLLQITEYPPELVEKILICFNDLFKSKPKLLKILTEKLLTIFRKFKEDNTKFNLLKTLFFTFFLHQDIPVETATEILKAMIVQFNIKAAKNIPQKEKTDLEQLSRNLGNACLFIMRNLYLRSVCLQMLFDHLSKEVIPQQQLQEMFAKTEAAHIETINKVEKDLKEAENKINAQKKALQEAQQAAQLRNQKNSELTQTIREMDTAIDSLQAQIKAFEIKSRQQEEENKELRRQISTLTQQVDQIEKRAKKWASLNPGVPPQILTSLECQISYEPLRDAVSVDQSIAPPGLRGIQVANLASVMEVLARNNLPTDPFPPYLQRLHFLDDLMKFVISKQTEEILVFTGKDSDPLLANLTTIEQCSQQLVSYCQNLDLNSQNKGRLNTITTQLKGDEIQLLKKLLSLPVLMKLSDLMMFAHLLSLLRATAESVIKLILLSWGNDGPISQKTGATPLVHSHKICDQLRIICAQLNCEATFNEAISRLEQSGLNEHRPEYSAANSQALQIHPVMSNVMKRLVENPSPEDLEVFAQQSREPLICFEELLAVVNQLLQIRSSQLPLISLEHHQ